MLQQSQPDRANQLLLEAKRDIADNWRSLTAMAANNDNYRKETNHDQP